MVENKSEEPHETETEKIVHDTVRTLRELSGTLALHAGQHPGAASLKKLLDQGLRFFSHLD